MYEHTNLQEGISAGCQQPARWHINGLNSEQIRIRLGRWGSPVWWGTSEQVCTCPGGVTYIVSLKFWKSFNMSRGVSVWWVSMLEVSTCPGSRVSMWVREAGEGHGIPMWPVVDQWQYRQWSHEDHPPTCEKMTDRRNWKHYLPQFRRATVKIAKGEYLPDIESFLLSIILIELWLYATKTNHSGKF